MLNVIHKQHVLLTLMSAGIPDLTTDLLKGLKKVIYARLTSSFSSADLEITIEVNDGIKMLW